MRLLVPATIYSLQHHNHQLSSHLGLGLSLLSFFKQTHSYYLNHIFHLTPFLVCMIHTIMASACVNNSIGISPEPAFLDLPPWLSPSAPEPDFEFPLDTPATMLPADQLFSDGKLVPLHLKPPYKSTSHTAISSHTPKSPSSAATAVAITATADPYLFSPKAPRCSSRWKDLLGLKKLYQTTNTVKTTTTPSSSKSLKNFLHRGASKTTSFSENAPLLTSSDASESLSISSSRLSLSSSSSSGHDHDDLPRLSLDSEKPNPNPNPNTNHNQISLHRNPNPRIRLVKNRTNSFDSNKTASDQHSQPSRPGRSPIRRESETVACRGVSVDSPRMNSSGKIVFQSLERSSSSPSTFNGGPRFKHRGMERSYSANVRVTPVLNVPVCSLRGASKSGSVFGFGQLFSSPQKREGATNNKGHRSNRN